MSKQEKFRFWYEIGLSALTVGVGLAFLLSAANIYGTEGAYSPAIVWSRLKWLLIPLCLWIVAIVVGVVISCKIPDTKKRATKADPVKTLERLKGRLPVEGEESEELLTKLNKMEKLRRIVRICGGVVTVLCAVMMGVVLFQTRYYAGEDLNAEVVQMVGRVLPWACIAFFVSVGVVVNEQIVAKLCVSLLVEWNRAHPAAKREKAEQAPLAESEKRARGKKYLLWGARIAVFVVAVTLIGLGIANKGALDVLSKAINICTECIGLG